MSGQNVNTTIGTNTTSRNKYRPINLRDLFVAPPFDELDAVAMDSSGEPRRLTNTQLKSLRDRGFVKKNLYFYTFKYLKKLWSPSCCVN